MKPFCEKVDWGASASTAEMMLNGECDNDQSEEVAQSLIKHMKKKTELDEIHNMTTIDEWTGKIKAWKESTLTSPSGFHLTHSKALVSGHDICLESDEGTMLEDKRLKLMKWQVELINLAARNRHSCERWKTTANVMILKIRAICEFTGCE